MRAPLYLAIPPWLYVIMESCSMSESSTLVMQTERLSNLIRTLPLMTVFICVSLVCYHDGFEAEVHVKQVFNSLNDVMKALSSSSAPVFLTLRLTFSLPNLLYVSQSGMQLWPLLIVPLIIQLLSRLDIRKLLFYQYVFSIIPWQCIIFVCV